MLAAWTTAVTVAPHQVQVGPARVWLRPFYSAYEHWLAGPVTSKLCNLAILRRSISTGEQDQGCPSNEPKLAIGHLTSPAPMR